MQRSWIDLGQNILGVIKSALTSEAIRHPNDQHTRSQAQNRTDWGRNPGHGRDSDRRVLGKEMHHHECREIRDSLGPIEKNANLKFYQHYPRV